jgi:hypothetical protein
LPLQQRQKIQELLFKKGWRTMKRRVSIATIGICATLAMATLWWRVQRLERQVDSLTQQLQSSPRALYLPSRAPATTQSPDKQKIFKLIDAADARSGTSHIGVPWNVERAMMIDAIERGTEAPRVIESPSVVEGQIDVGPPILPNELPEAAPAEIREETAF